MHVKNKSRDTTVLLRQMTLETQKRVKRLESSVEKKKKKKEFQHIPLMQFLQQMEEDIIIRVAAC